MFRFLCCARLNMGDAATSHLIGRISVFSQNNFDILNHSTNVEHVYGGAGWGWR